MKKENLLIYAGSAIFFILVISLGIFMYKAVDEQAKIGENTNSTIEQEIEKETEKASTEIGKTVEEQENEVNTTETPAETKKENKTNNVETNAKPIEQVEEKVNQEQTTEEKEEPKVTETKVEVTFVAPVEGEIICEYAKDNLIYSETLKEWVTHTAIDIKADKTSIVKASADGIVKSIVNDPRYGLTVVVEHADGFKTVYSNLLTAEFIVEGEEIKQEQTIGTVGNTASFESRMETHLHFEIIKDGEYVDPKIYLK